MGKTVQKSGPVSLSDLRPLNVEIRKKILRTDEGRAPERDPNKVDIRNMTICITGVMPLKRADMEEHLASHNVTVVSRVTQKVDVLVVGSNPGKSKKQKAYDYGVPVRSWESIDRGVLGF